MESIFYPLQNLVDRVRKNQNIRPYGLNKCALSIAGKIIDYYYEWSTNGCISIHITFDQTEPSIYCFEWDPYAGSYPGSWIVSNYYGGEWLLDYEEQDAMLKPYQPPYTFKTFNAYVWDGGKFLVNKNKQVVIFEGGV